VDTLTGRAEDAVIGVVLREPWMAGTLAVSAHQFASPSRGAIFEAATSIRGPALGPAAAIEEVAARAGVPEQYLEQLTGTCPDPVHGYRYAVLVAEAAGLRQIRSIAQTLGRRARELSAEARDMSAAVGPEALETGRRADHAADQARALTENASQFNPDTMRSPAAVVGGSSLSAASREQSRLERQVLAALVRQHPDSGKVLETLSLDAFRSPLNRLVYEAIAHLREAGEPVDSLLVDWQLMRGSPGTEATVEGGAHPGPDQPSYVTALSMFPGRGPVLPAANLLAAGSTGTGNGHRPAVTGVPRLITPGTSVRHGQVPGLLEPPPQVPDTGQAPGQAPGQGR
jgi:hypothetical protein